MQQSAYEHAAGHMSAPDDASEKASKSLLRLGRLHMLHKGAAERTSPFPGRIHEMNPSSVLCNRVRPSRKLHHRAWKSGRPGSLTGLEIAPTGESIGRGTGRNGSWKSGFYGWWSPVWRFLEGVPANFPEKPTQSVIARTVFRI